MTPSIRVLVVDDSVVVRRLISDVIATEPSIEVVGSAPNGQIAIAKVGQLTPDLVTLDVDMPEMDGLATLAALRRDHPRLPVIMFSSHTQRAAAATIEALTLGASDYVTKPVTANLGEARDQIRRQLIPVIRALCQAPAPTPPRVTGQRGQRLERARAVAIGVSTGGPRALQTLLSALPNPFGAPIFIVQHMPPMFTAQLAQRLEEACHRPVSEATTRTQPEANHIYIAPGDFHLVLERTGSTIVMRTQQTAPENSCRPSVDVLFRSAADSYGSSLLGVVLTGMGQDGLRGAERIRAAGGHVLVQDEASSIVWGMPGAVARAGLADRVVPLAELADAIAARVPRTTSELARLQESR
jgi:two-component system chemotaxis response regulator CheB